MILHFKFDMSSLCKIVLQEQLDKLKIQFKISGLGEVEIKEMLSGSKYNELEMLLKKYGIEIIDDPKNILVQKIKDLIIEMINSEDNHTTAKISDYLADNCYNKK